PRSSLIVDSGKLYGGTSGGGDVSGGVDGTIFSMDSTGTNFTLLHKFAAESGDGRLPVGYLILDSGKLYGMTGLGGDSNDGTVFSMNTNGSGFALLHEFGGGSDDGIGPQGGLVLDSGKLYGMTEMGGDSNDGTIFSIDTDGGNFTLLHEFAGESDDGALPAGRLVLEAGKLYGTTNKGGDSDLGTVFSMNTDGGNFTLLHDFTGGSDDGDNPHGSLIWDSGKLYGMTDLGGDSNVGTIFVLPDHLPGDVNGNGYVDGTDLTIIISHWGQSGLGREFGDLNDNGVVDGPDYAEVLSYWNPPPEPPSEAVPEPATLGLMLIGGLVLLRRRR
ncbi:MAG: PEP-CTERM sorting domain-containing protein, partial [Phycisphaerae bacterium]|nr:PEP-CTERM sorting domain-containing protein [Phycisphaerae bacterium]